MAKYLMLWKFNGALVPVNPRERGKTFTDLTAFVQQDIDRGIIKDWGCFVGEGNGYCVVDGNEVDICKLVQRYNPFCYFSTRPVASLQHMNEVLNFIAG
jgi:hypothetical protein